MPKGYWIAHVDVSDPEKYKDYAAANAIAFKKYGARFLVLPSTAFWWLDHYKDFAAHLAQNHRLVARQENVAFIYELLEPRVAGEPVPNPVSTTTRNPSRLLPRPAPRRPKRDAVRRGPHGKGARGLKDKFPG